MPTNSTGVKLFGIDPFLLTFVFGVAFLRPVPGIAAGSCANAHLKTTKPLAEVHFAAKPSKISRKRMPLSKSTRINLEISRKGKGWVVRVHEIVTLRRLLIFSYHYGDFTTEIIATKSSERSKHVKEIQASSQEQAKAIVENLTRPQEECFSCHAYDDATRNRMIKVELNPRAFAELKTRALSSMDFVFREYMARKETWPPEFLQRLFVARLAYLLNSTIINNYGPNGLILASGQITKAPYTQFSKRSSDPLGVLVDSIQSQATEKELLKSEIDLITESLTLDFVNRSSPDYSGRFGFDPAMGQEIFPEGRLYLNSENVEEIRPETAGDLIYLPAPMEYVLGRRHPELRTNAGTGLAFIEEPGALAISQNMSESLHHRVTSAMYYHSARLLRGPAPLATFAEQGSSSDRFYRSLGFRDFSVHNGTDSREPLEPQPFKPTDKPWNVLIAAPNSMIRAMKARFRIKLDEGNLERELEAGFLRLDKNENF